MSREKVPARIRAMAEAELNGGPEMPFQISHVWSWFQELHPATRATGMGVAPLTYLEIMSWLTLTKRQATTLEIRLLIALEALWKKEFMSAKKK